jgi:hypothetical protein
MALITPHKSGEEKSPARKLRWAQTGSSSLSWLGNRYVLIAVFAYCGAPSGNSFFKNSLSAAMAL